MRTMIASRKESGVRQRGCGPGQPGPQRVCGDFEDMGAILYAAEATDAVTVFLRGAGHARVPG